MFEFLVFVVTAMILPVVINKSTEGARFDWIHPHLRKIWAAIFVFFSLYLLQKPSVLEITLKLRGATPPMIGYAGCAIVGALVLCGYWWFAGKVLAESSPGPDLIAEFINTSDIYLVISNPTSSTAEQPKFATFMVDLDKRAGGILPIPQQTGDYLRGGASLVRIPMLHYGNNAVLNIIKPKDRLLGWLILSCANCKKIRWYWIFYEYTVGGWFAEAIKQPDSQLLHRMAQTSDLSMLDELVPPNNRKPIRNINGIVRYPEQGTLR